MPTLNNPGLLQVIYILRSEILVKERSEDEGKWFYATSNIQNCSELTEPL